MTTHTSWAHKKTAFACVGLIAFMVGASYAAVPLYDLFCRVTGFGGTTQVATVAPQQVLERSMRIRFDSNTAPELPWAVKPEMGYTDVKVGETRTVYYWAHNLSKDDLVGIASYNVTPERAGMYFSKLQCFCFNDTPLARGQKLEMPVVFFVDPAIHDDPQLQDLKEITLSYTMFPSKKTFAEMQKTLKRTDNTSTTTTSNGG